jgi:hypothetical protein
LAKELQASPLLKRNSEHLRRRQLHDKKKKHCELKSINVQIITENNVKGADGGGEGVWHLSCVDFLVGGKKLKKKYTKCLYKIIII